MLAQLDSGAVLSVTCCAAGYLDACGGGIHLQIGRTVSVDKTLGKHSLHRDGSASFMLESDSLQDEVQLRVYYTVFELQQRLVLVSSTAFLHDEVQPAGPGVQPRLPRHCPGVHQTTCTARVQRGPATP